MADEAKLIITVKNTGDISFDFDPPIMGENQREAATNQMLALEDVIARLASGALDAVK